jgi:outer membrane immunogenic protein
LKQIYLAASVVIAAVAGTLAPAHAQVSNPWNGLYVGLNAGYAWQDVNGTFDGSGVATNLTGIDLNGAIVGGQLGYNWQSGQFLLGIEGDASTLVQGGDHVVNNGLPGAATLGADMSYLASIRGRLGWAINNWLLYGTVGWGFSRFEFTENVPSIAFDGKQHLDDSGIVYGGGVEWMLAYGVSVRAEYLRYDLGASSPLPASFPSVDLGDNIAFDNIDVARAALNIKLSN